MTSFLRGLWAFLRGALFLRSHQDLSKYVWLAFGINMVVFAALLIVFIVFFEDLVDAASPGFLGPVGEWILRVVLVVLAILLFLFLYTLVGNAIAGPFMDMMAERILADLGEPIPPSRPFIRMILVSLGRQGQKLTVFLACQALALLLWVIPVVGGILHAAISAGLVIFFLGFDYMDYPLDIRGMPVFARYGFCLRHLPGTMGLGAVAFCLTLVPFLGYFCTPLGVAGATLLVHDLEPPGNPREIVP